MLCHVYAFLRYELTARGDPRSRCPHVVPYPQPRLLLSNHHGEVRAVMPFWRQVCPFISSKPYRDTMLTFFLNNNAGSTSQPFLTHPPAPNLSTAYQQNQATLLASVPAHKVVHPPPLTKMQHITTSASTTNCCTCRSSKTGALSTLPWSTRHAFLYMSCWRYGVYIDVWLELPHRHNLV